MSFGKTYPYYKIQYWHKHSMAWLDIQRSYKTLELAKEAAPRFRQTRWRIMEVKENSRAPVYTNRA